MPRLISTLMALVIVAAFIPARRVSAAFLTETVSTVPDRHITDFSQALAIPTFDPSLGTLKSVSFGVADGGIFQGTVFNQARSAQNYLVIEDAQMNLSFGGISILSNDLTAEQHYVGLDPNSSAAFGAYSVLGSSGPASYASGPIFDAFLQSSSDVVVSFWTLTSTTISGGGGNMWSDIQTTAGATVTVTFQYEPLAHGVLAIVPEPGSLAMTLMGGLIVGAAGLAGRRARMPHDR